MQRLDKLFFDAITADEELMEVVGRRVKSTCYEVAPGEKDTTPLPYIIVMDEGKAPNDSTKDDNEWLPSNWNVAAGVEVGAKSPNQVDDIIMMVMKAIARYMQGLAEQGVWIPRPKPEFPQTQGTSWDWQKPCYFDIVHYQCDVNIQDDEQ